LPDPRHPELSNRALVILGGASTDRPSVGVEMRRHHLVRAVGRVAQLEIFVVQELDEDELAEMSSIYGARVGCVRSGPRGRSRLSRFIGYLRHMGWPTRIAGKDWQAWRQSLRSWMSSYQLTFVENVEDYVVLAPILQRPVVVDHDDRDSDVLRQVRPLLRKADKGRGPQLRLLGRGFSACKTVGRDLYLMLDQYRWLRAERLVMRRADRVLVASPDDLVTSGNPQKALVIPNGFEPTGPPSGAGDVHTPPTIAFWGLMAYRPNRDGAEWFLGEILPRLADRIPDIRVLLMGSGSESVRIPDRRRVVATGFVDDLSPFLSQTDVAVIPLRQGGGTRIKILEAWANNIPVVSTSIGAYGLGAVHGENVLLADDPKAFASAVAVALENPAVRNHLIAEGAARAAAFRWSTIENDLSAYLSSMAEGGSSR